MWECIRHWPVCPGVFIAVLAFMASIAAFRKDPGPRERAAWVFLFLMLTCGEIWMMSKDREKNDESHIADSAAQLNGFKEVGRGIEKAIEQSDRNFNATMGKESQLLANVTGGDSFCYAVAMVTPNDTFVLTVMLKGANPLHNIDVQMVDGDIERKMLSSNHAESALDNYEAITTHYPTIAFLGTVGPRMIGRIPVGDSAKRDFHFVFFSMNGVWLEDLDLRKVNGIWLNAIRVRKEVQVGHKMDYKSLYIEIPKNYPKTNGEMEWNGKKP
jgi:hypothetical protein